MTQRGGTFDEGTAFRMNPDGTGFEVLHAFNCSIDGCFSFAGLTQGSDGKFYGTTVSGGGTAFRMNGDGTGFEILHFFNCSVDGCQPVAGLTQGSDGKFYGTAQALGALAGGTTFRMNADGTGFQVLHAFNCSVDGCQPVAGLTQGSDGKFYGTAQARGALAGGTTFRMNADGTGFEVLHAFNCSDGCFPSAGLTQGDDGKFYGTTLRGAGFGVGTAFRMNADGTGLDVIHILGCGTDGCAPAAGLTQGSDGKFYGMANGGGALRGGTAFRMNGDGTAFQVLHAFNCSVDGCGPLAGLTQGSDGKFYGTTPHGGAFGGGTAFRMNGDGTAFQVLHAFDCSVDGCQPVAGLTQGSDGNLYGTAPIAGALAGGTAFRLNADGTGFEVLHAFQCASDGCSPSAALAQGSDGKLYGTALNGNPLGGSGSGSVFRLNINGTGFQLLHAFSVADGDLPSAGLTQGRDGKFYGTAQTGGAKSGGTAFRLNADGTGFEVLHDFGLGDGHVLLAGLTQRRDRKFYGTTQTGGASGGGGGGTVFRLNADGTEFEVLHAFDCAATDDACHPFAGLTQGSDGKLYGTASSGGEGREGGGAVFRMLVPFETTPPTIIITVPSDGQEVFLAQSISAAYTCDDSSGIDACSGPVPNGSPLDTSSVGTKNFTVSAIDGVGNSGSLSHTYFVVYRFTGFFPPVDNLPVSNSVKAGSAVPVKFSLGGGYGLNVLAPGYPRSDSIQCDTTARVEPVEETVTAGSGLTYDPATNTYVYVWKTDKTWAGSCRQFVLRLNDGKEYQANFNFD
jgi:uncharacterized repeat protein (TIGR03803 family)